MQQFPSVNIYLAEIVDSGNKFLSWVSDVFISVIKNDAEEISDFGTTNLVEFVLWVGFPFYSLISKDCCLNIF